MSLDSGIVLLIQSCLGSPPIAPGGFYVQLPKDFLLTRTGATCAYTYSRVDTTSQRILNARGRATVRVRIRCFGVDGAAALTLANKIGSHVSMGGIDQFRGTLPDSDSTWVDTILLDDVIDSSEVDPTAGDYWRLLEFLVTFNDM